MKPCNDSSIESEKVRQNSNGNLQDNSGRNISHLKINSQGNDNTFSELFIDLIESINNQDDDITVEIAKIILEKEPNNKKIQQLLEVHSLITQQDKVEHEDQLIDKMIINENGEYEYQSSEDEQVKQLCEEFCNANYNEEGVLRVLLKILSNLKISDKFQKEVFISLSDKGLNKLLSLFKDANLEIRKTSFKIMIELLYGNEVLQNIFCEKFGFNPIGNTICLNWLPRYIKENVKIDEKLLNEIKNVKNQQKLKYWMWPENPKYNDDTLPDPQKYLLGFFYSNKNSLFSANNDEKEEKFDTKLLLNKLENENLEEEKAKYVPAGSGSESSAKINETLKEKYTMMSEPINTITIQNNNNGPVSESNNLPQFKSNLSIESNNTVSKKPTPTQSTNQTSTVKQNFALDVNSILEKIKIQNANQNSQNDKLGGIKKIKEEYKKTIKDKNYSRSIDANIPKIKNNLGSINNVTNFQINQISTQAGITNISKDDLANRIKINRLKK